MKPHELIKWLQGRTVLVTGHTGFKGAWLVCMLNNLGAKVVGLSLPPETPSLFEAAQIQTLCTHVIGDIREFSQVEAVFTQHQPEIIFHLAAQALVRPSYSNPLESFSTNILGTAHVLEAGRKCKATKAIVCVTTDKVYENIGQGQAFTESNNLGGKDPYSASKAAAEIVASCYMQTLNGLGNGVRLATARGGNVIGGGDFAQDRILPDCMRAIQANKALVLRNPEAVRPWQHVLDLCYGYLLLAHALDTTHTPHTYIGAWNFGPSETECVSVKKLLLQFIEYLGVNLKLEILPTSLPEHAFLNLNSAKARNNLLWQPKFNTQEAIQYTADWYRAYEMDKNKAHNLMQEQIKNYF